LIFLYQTAPKIGLGLLLAFGTFAVGGLMGFLFGVPGGGAEAQSPAEARRRTNLELISDWLTKVLLGAGLVQLKPILSATWSFAESMGTDLGSPHATYFVLATIAGFASSGVLTGYLWSQFHFKPDTTSDFK